jgi:hypothetical protein
MDRRTLRWWELAPEAAVALGLGWFGATETPAATSAFGSSTALALMAATGGGWLVARAVAARFVPWAGIRLAGFALAALVVLAAVVLPAYDDTTVIETFPVAVPTTTVESTAPTAPTAPTASVEPARPTELAAAPLHGIDHRAAGTVRLYRAPDGSFVVGLEDIDIQPGPDYDVYVVPGDGAESPGGGTRLDDLRGNRGTQFYAVPVGADLGNGPWTVLVWCERFDVPVAAATPQSAV